MILNIVTMVSIVLGLIKGKIKMANYTKIKKLSDDELDKVRKAIDYSGYFNKKIYPNMEEYYRHQPIDFVANTGKCLCPFHHDDDASFHIRTWSDGVTTFKCFGCSVGGDIVKLHILYAKEFEDRNIRYGEAAQELYDEFIEGRNIGRAALGTKIHLKSDEVVEVNNLMDVVDFSNVLSRYEGFLLNDKVVNQEARMEYYTLADKLELLVGKSLVSAKAATEALKEAYEKTKIESVEELER